MEKSWQILTVVILVAAAILAIYNSTKQTSTGLATIDISKATIKAESSYPAHQVEKLADKSTTTYWLAEVPNLVSFSFEDKKTITKMRIVERENWIESAKTYTVQYKDSEGKMIDLVIITKPEQVSNFDETQVSNENVKFGTGNDYGTYDELVFPPLTTNMIRIKIDEANPSESNWVAIYEIVFFE